MKCNTSKPRDFTLLPLLLVFLFFIIFSIDTSAQGMRMEKGEAASCIIKVNNPGATGKMKNTPSPVKIHEVSPNQYGVFEQVSNIRRSEKVLLELSYPSAKPGEKVVVIVLDGGSLDNGKKVKAMTINDQRKCPFAFSVTENAGLYRLLVRKENDAKVIRLWVGEDITAIKK